MLSQGQINNFEIEHNLQVYYKVLQGIYIGTFTDTDNKKHYGYNQSTNSILKP